MRVLPRGNWLDESGDPVLPGTPGFLPALKVSSTPSRLDLANWLFSERHPLTARVMVNRLWKLFLEKASRGPLKILAHRESSLASRTPGLVGRGIRRKPVEHSASDSTHGQLEHLPAKLQD